MSDTQKPYSLTDLRRMLRCRKTWPKFAPQLAAAQKQNEALNILRLDAAFSHFLGGCHAVLQEQGRISRPDFIRLLNAATHFGQSVNH